MRVILLSALCLLTACGPTCEERGGESRFSHFQTIWGGKTVTLVPIYKCEGASFE